MATTISSIRIHAGVRIESKYQSGLPGSCVQFVSSAPCFVWLVCVDQICDNERGDNMLARFALVVAVVCILVVVG